MKPKKHSRWYHIDPETGEKVIRRFGVDEDPGAPWIRGIGPHTPEVRAKITEYNRKHFKDKPKSPEQREKMSKAHTGKRFTDDHRQKLKESWETKRVERRERNIEAMREAMAYIKELKTQNV